MRNADRIIYLTTKRGRKFTFRKKGNAWIQKTPVGRTYKMTAEQVLSHLLPALTNARKGISIKATPRKRKRK